MKGGRLLIMHGCVLVETRRKVGERWAVLALIWGLLDRSHALGFLAYAKPMLMLGTFSLMSTILDTH